jgi:hypothetical protein
MDPKQIAKQMIDFNKAAFDNSFNTMAILQDQIEKMASTALEQNNVIPAEGKKAVSAWIKSHKKGLDDFKAAADESFKKVETFFAIK